ncbi:MAG: PAS domain S-box protein [Opitutales bacterium]|nr:PAS domain S-box protein [Opitutales bacterium]
MDDADIAASPDSPFTSSLNSARESIAFLGSLIDSIHNPIFFKDTEGIYIGCNAAFCEFLGKPKRDIIGRSVFELSSPEDASVYWNMDRELFAKGGSQIYQKRIIFKDGDYKVVRFEKAVYYHTDGSQAGIVGSIFDLTDIIRAEERLQREHQLVTTLVNMLPEMICVKDRELRYLVVNQSFAEYVGAPDPDACKGKWDGDFMPEEEWLNDAREEQALLENGRLIAREEKVQAPRSGETLWLRTMKVPLRGSGNDIVGLVIQRTDITQPKSLERKLVQLESIVNDSTSIALLIECSQNWPIAFISENVFQFGYTAMELYDGKVSFFDLIHKEDRERIRTDYESMVNDGIREMVREYRITTRSGIVRWIEDRRKLLRNPLGRITHLQGILTDITRRKLDEEKHKLMDVQLRQAQKLEAIGQLAAGIAHEINTPVQFIGDNIRFLHDVCEQIGPLMNVLSDFKSASTHAKAGPEMINRIAGAVEPMDVDFLRQEMPEAISQTTDGVRRISEIVRAMKEFSHPSAAGFSLVDINHSLENAVTVSRNEWKYVADIETDLDSSLPLVPCLATQLNQAILNILVNAAQAIGESVNKGLSNRGKIVIATRKDEASVVIRISDTGPGIPDKIRDRVFEPFFTTKDVGKGTGQGLTIAYDVVTRLHHGKLSFDSKAGEGTVFRIELPLVQPEPPIVEPPDTEPQH